MNLYIWEVGFGVISNEVAKSYPLTLFYAISVGNVTLLRLFLRFPSFPVGYRTTVHQTGK